MPDIINIEVVVKKDFYPGDLSHEGPGFKLNVKRESIQEGFSDGESKVLLDLALEIVGNVALSLFASYLYDKLKGKTEKLWINDHKTKVDKVEIMNITQVYVTQINVNNGDAVNNQEPASEVKPSKSNESDQ